MTRRVVPISVNNSSRTRTIFIMTRIDYRMLVLMGLVRICFMISLYLFNPFPVILNEKIGHF
jgi:hypothetical protein